VVCVNVGLVLWHFLGSIVASLQCVYQLLFIVEFNMFPLLLRLKQNIHILFTYISLHIACVEQVIH